jgi:hypothetical protein
VSVERSIVGEEDSTLLSQIKLSRQDTNDRLDRLQRSHVEFAQKLAENNSKALILALQQVIRDFNTKISEQFGENFKQLNVAVGQLLTWQESYRVQLSEMIEQQSRTADNMKSATDRYTTMVSKAEAFGTLSAQLSTVLSGLETQRNHLQGALESLGKVLTAASSGLPQLQTRIELLTEQVTHGVKQNQEAMTAAIKTSAASLQETIADAKNLLVEANQAANRQVNDHIKQISDRTTEQFTKLDAALETELSKSISSLARQLTALSNRFVEDYTPLTESLRSIVRASSRGG